MGGEVGVDVPKIWAIIVLFFDSFKASDFYLTSRQQGHSPTERIWDAIFTTSLMLEHKCVGLQIFYPSSMSDIQLLLKIEVFQSFMVRKDYELLWQQVVSPVLERLHHSIKLLVICGVPHSRITEFFTEVGYRVPFLTDNTAYPYS